MSDVILDEITSMDDLHSRLLIRAPDYPFFPEFCAKSGAILHTFPEIGIYLRFMAIRGFYGDVQNAFVRFWEADLRPERAPECGNERKACLIASCGKGLAERFSTCSKIFGNRSFGIFRQSFSTLFLKESVYGLISGPAHITRFFNSARLMVPSSRLSATMARSWRSSFMCSYSVSGRMMATLFPFSSVTYCPAELMGIPCTFLFPGHDITDFSWMQMPGLSHDPLS